VAVVNSSQTTIGCITTQTRTWTATDACGNTATTSRTVSWSNDNNPPVFTGTYAPQNLGCNPTASDITNALGSATASDVCGTPTVTQNDGAVSSSGCTRTQVRTFTARDACGNTSTVSKTVNWTSDLTPPVFNGTYNNSTLGCNPTSSAINAALGSASATDVCGTATVTQTDGAVTTSSCTLTQTRTFTATDICGNTSTVSRTVTWTSDLTPPVISASGTTLTLGCNPVASDINAALGSATATDACGSITVTQSDAVIISSGCNRNQTRTFTATDACGNTATISRTAAWVFDQTSPVFIGTYTNTTLV
jgi:hypothetical protein